MFEKRVTIIKINKPQQKELNVSLQWFGNSLGLFNERDKDSSCFRVFIELIKASKMREPMSSDLIAEKLELSRGTVIHHVNKLMGSGLVVRERQGYMMRVDNLSSLIEEVHRDVSKTCRELKQVAEEIDDILEL